MILKNFSQTIGVYPNMLSKKVCSDLIDAFEKSKNKLQGETTGGINTDLSLIHI